MKQFDTDKPAERVLKEKATRLRLPFGGGMELLPLCNMHCNMCYVRREETGILSAKEWIEIGRSARDAGVLMLLLTGGEPLLHPGFGEIYLELQKMGLVLSVNTNGTLLDEEWADFFCENPCRRIKVTLYGGSDETYGRLCHYSEGFEKTVRALELLKERGISCHVNMTIVRENRQDLSGMRKIARRFDAQIVPGFYEYPPLRGGDAGDFQNSRMSPGEAAESYVEEKFLSQPPIAAEYLIRTFFAQLTTDAFESLPLEKGLGCTAGKSDFWINWKGELTACAMIPEPAFDLKKYSFSDAWQRIAEHTQTVETCRKCCACRKKFFCPACAAAGYTEEGDREKAPKYLCRYTDEVIRILFSHLPENEKGEQREALANCGLPYNF